MSSIIKVEYDVNFRLLEITESDGSTYTLDGYCSQCGQCCKNPNYDVGYNDENGVCTKLIYETVDGVIKYRCAIYSNRPVSCLLWPKDQSEIDDHSQCTFKFTKKE